jgi:ATP-dependent Clp protease adaptor protein ClpS
MTETVTLEEIDLKELLVEKRDLMLFNDDVNTFDHVIESLVKVCRHETIQAEQCAHIVHFKGKCQVKSGEYEKLEPLCTALLDRGLRAKIL